MIVRGDPAAATRHPGRGCKDGAAQLLARAELRRQIGRLEGELAHLTFDGLGRVVVPHRVAGIAPNPRILDLGELERLRDELVERTGEARDVLAGKAAAEAANRELLRRMIDAPGEHRWLRVSRADVGEPGCGHWHSRPRLGPLGMLMGWWRVVVSSGCPRAGRLAAATPIVRSPGEAGRPCRASRDQDETVRLFPAALGRVAGGDVVGPQVTAGQGVSVGPTARRRSGECLQHPAARRRSDPRRA